MGEQPNPWDLSLPPLLVGQDYTFTMAIRVTTNALGASRVIGLVSRFLSHLRRQRTYEGSVVTGDESLDHCRRILTPSSRADVQSGQCICPSSYLFQIVDGVDSVFQNQVRRAATLRLADAAGLL